MKEYYAARASSYDAIYQKPERQENLRILEQWVTDIATRRTVLEIACGTGYWTRFLAASAARVTATDAVQETLDIAKARQGNEAVTFAQSDVYDMKVFPEPSDLLFAGFWLSHVPLGRIRGFLSSLTKNLAPSAKVVFIDNVYVEGSSTPIHSRDAEGNTYQLRKLPDGSTHTVLKNFPSEAELRQHIDGVGIRPEFKLHKYYWTFQYESVV